MRRTVVTFSLAAVGLACGGGRSPGTHVGDCATDAGRRR